MKKLDQKGSHVLVVLLVVIVVAAIAGVGWYVFNKQKSKTASNGSAQVAQKCESNDKDLCKFFSSWKNNKYYTVDSTSTTGGKASTMKIAYVAPDRYHMTMTGEMTYETITIGDTTYTKDNTDGKWLKQTVAKDTAQSTQTEKVDFEEPATDKPAEQQTTYKLIGKEACGNLTCFKYQVIDPQAKDTTDYIWFDTKDYQLRKTSTESKDGKYEANFSYAKVEIKEPSPVKEATAQSTPGAPSQAEIDKAIQDAQQMAQ
jgi:hypothetical protein